MYQALNEQDLARSCAQGDRAAEEELYKRYAARMFTLCRRYTDNPEDAQDLMQEALLRALDRIATFTYAGNGSLYAWISRIAINMALNAIRRKRWRTLSLDFRAQDTIPEPTEEEMVEVPPEKLLEWIAALPALRRTVFNLYCIDGYSHKQIGEMLGISEKGSAGVLAKARKQLKETINRYLKDTEQ
ncbi:MAG: sigma-70 family RNA polymerase sigma factor [Bacteroidales bacterium]|nr:sigma-70 family RNA polymerase sigma factor [Bacteroidales bacterium]